MPTRFHTVVLFLLALFIGVRPTQAQSGTSPEEEVRAVMAQLNTAALQGNSEAASSLMKRILNERIVELENREVRLLTALPPRRT